MAKRRIPRPVDLQQDDALWWACLEDAPRGRRAAPARLIFDAAEVESSSLYSPVAVLKEARDALVNIEWPDACPHCAPKLSEAAAEGGA